MQRPTRQQLATLVVLTLVWGVNWPVMKLGVTGYPPITFRGLSMALGVPFLALVLVAMKVPFSVPRKDWRELLVLSATNMFVWHVCIILAVSMLSSGRAAILGYTMSIFSAVFGALFFASPLGARAWTGVAAAGLAVALLLWHELSNLAGRPGGVALALVAAAVWAIGTQLLRRTTIDRPTLTISFWMTAMTAVVMLVVAAVVERDRWAWPSPTTWGAVWYNAIPIFVFAHAAWFWLARSLPPVASTISVMFIPVLGVLTGALWLGEALHWQDWAAVLLIATAIGLVMLPARRA